MSSGITVHGGDTAIEHPWTSNNNMLNAPPLAPGDLTALKLNPFFADMSAAKISSLAPSNRTAGAGRMFLRRNEWTESLTVIRSGWACKILRLPDGRLQILSILLPGDFVSASAFFEERCDFSVQTITDLAVTDFPRDRIQSAVFGDPKLLEKFVKIITERKQRAYHNVAVLGRLTAVERVARLIVSLRERLAAAGMVEHDSFYFPLRQSQIADATGQKNAIK